ncbi:zinc ribbon domain-containing protein [Dysgonomonas capnocytophagoides]|uniref:zinc ribbon domain-containing protein n=1 Tax=Dysgonomonas capnocytophagoides TaxID=45254 RepID=UPI00141AFF56|nr:zinc ribbon domain-containing protein [Dysgonomonas capnocytophagoides]
MALINCSECGKQVSDKAVSCPSCGNPINQHTTTTSNGTSSLSNMMKCPKCDSTHLTSDKKGFSGRKAVAGAVLTGGIGLLAGTIGSNKTMITCLDCGYKYKAGEYSAEKRKFDNERALNKRISNGEESFVGLIIVGILFSILGAIISYNLYQSDWNFLGTLFAIATFICIIITIFVIYSENEKTSINKKAESKNNTNNKSSSDALSSYQLDNILKDYIRKGQLLQAVDFYRFRKGIEFKEAKDYVDNLASTINK